jgi:hypothetical protein
MTEDDIRVDEHARIRALVQEKARRLAELGRSRDADRWRAFSTWLRTDGAPPKEKSR